MASTFPESEADFSQWFDDLRRLTGWRGCHFRPALDRRGRWQTALQGDPGFLDWVLVRGTRVIFSELKREDGKVTRAQQEWLDDLRKCTGVESYLWRPSDRSQIEKVLAR